MTTERVEPQPLNICMVTDCYPPGVGGIENHVYALSRELGRLGHNVAVVTHKAMKPRGAEASPVAIPPCVEVIRLHGLTLRLHDGSDPALDPSMIGQFARILKSRDFDVVHGHTVESPFVLSLMLRAAHMGRPTVITKHSMVERPKRPPIVGGLMRSAMVRIASQFTAHIAVSEPAAEELQGTRAKVFVVRNAIDMDLFRPDSALRSATRAALGFGDEHLVVGFMSRFVPSKGLVELVDIGKRLIEQEPRLRFLFVGDGPLRSRVEREIRHMRLGERFRLVGFQPWPRTPAYLNAMDIFAFPSQSEGFGLALLEAMACGLPTATTDQPGTQNVVQNGTTALAADSLEELEAHLRRLMVDGDLRRRMGLAARNAVEHSQSWAAVAQRTAGVYRQAMALHQESQH